MLIPHLCFSKLYHTSTLQSSLNDFTQKLLAQCCMAQGEEFTQFFLIVFHKRNATKTCQSFSRNSGVYIHHPKSIFIFINELSLYLERLNECRFIIRSNMVAMSFSSQI